MKTANSYLLKGVIWMLFGLASIYYLMVTYRLSSSLPYLDDYDALVGFLISMKTETALAGKIGLLFQPHNEHYIVVPKMVVWVQYMLTGQLDLRTTILLANCMLVLGLFFLVRLCIAKKLWGLPVAILLLFMNYSHYENYQWALSGLQNYGLLLMVILCFVSLDGKKYLVALLFAMLAALCSSPGILLWVCIGLFFVFRKRYAYALVSILCFGLMAVWFSGNANLGMHQNEGFSAVLQSPGDFLGYLLILQVSFLKPFLRSVPNVAIALGICMLIFNFIGMLRLYLHNRFNFLIYLNLFLHGTLLLIAVNRFNFGFDQAFASRYLVFTILYLFTTILLWIDEAPLGNKHMAITFVGVIFASLLFRASEKLYQPYAVEVKNYLNGTKCEYLKNRPTTLSYIGKNDPVVILTRAGELRILKLDCD